MNEQVHPKDQFSDEERRARDEARLKVLNDAVEAATARAAKRANARREWSGVGGEGVQRPQAGSAGGSGSGGDGGGTRPTSRADAQLPAPRANDIIEVRESVPAPFSPSSAYTSTVPDESGLDLRKYLWLVFKHRWLILGAVVVFLCLGAAVTFLTTPIYRASTTLQINRDAPNVTNVQDVEPAAGNGDAEFYQTQYELLRSRTLAERVASTLALQDNASFVSADTVSPWTRVRRMLFGSAPRDDAAPAAVAVRAKRAADIVLGNLNVEPVRRSSIVKVSFDSPDRALAAKIANAVADSYIAISLERRYDASAYARSFLQDRLQELKKKLEESEKGLVAYAEQQNIVGDGSKQTLAQTNLESASADLAKATTDRLRAELLWQQAESSDGLGLPQILEDKSIQALRASRADLAAQYQDKLAFFKPAYPEMKRLQSQIDEIDRQINDAVSVVKTSIKAEYDAAVSNEKSLTDQLEKLKGDVTDAQNRNIQYTILQREVDTNRQLYDSLLQRYKEIGVAGGVGSNNISIVDTAAQPDAPYKPNLPRNLGLALALGLLAGVGAAFAREQLDDTFKSPEDLEENLGLPLLGMIPLSENAEDHAKLLDDPKSEISEAYRSLRTAVQFSTTTGFPRSLLITSSRPSEGKSTTAVMLARNFADLGMRVLLIDADLRKPSLHKHLNASTEVGLSNCLTGATPPPHAFQKTVVPRLTLITAGPLPPNPVELLAGSKMLSLLTVAAEEYDLVIVDSPPVAGLADAPILASMMVGTMLVVDGSATRRAIAKATLKRLYFARAQMIGVVLNKLDMTHQAYGYGYGYGYGAAYGGAGYGEAPALPKPPSKLQGLLGRTRRQ
jgi:capsular exopolysaccharide synthesis family protein